MLDNKLSLEEFRNEYREEIDYIFKNCIKLFIEDNNLPIVDMNELYYDIIKYLYLASI